MATQSTNIIDQDELDKLRRQLEGDTSFQVPAVVRDAISGASAVAEPVREVFVAIPEIKTFAVGYLFGAGTLALAILILNIAR